MKSKPLLIVPPAPNRWHAVEELLAHEPPPRLNDLRRRLADGLDGARDAIAIMPDGAHARAIACIRRRGPIGVFSHLYTQDSYRGRGFARRLVQTLLGWFDMTGGRWLYAQAPADLFERFLCHFGFQALHQAQYSSGTQALLVRRLGHVAPDPYLQAAGAFSVRSVTRADCPLIVALLAHRRGPDPRVTHAESALAAEDTALDLLAQQDEGRCHLLAATCKGRFVGLGSVAIDRLGDRTHAMLMPYGEAPGVLREALLRFARSKGYEHVDFPLEALGSESRADTATGSAGAADAVGG